MLSPYRAVITGVGCVSPFGVGGYPFIADVLEANATAIRPLRNFPTDGLTSHLGAEILPTSLPDTDETRRWSRLSYMTVVACRQAVADAGLSGAEALQSAGLVVGSEFGDLRSTEALIVGFLRKGPVGLSPLLFPSTVMNAMAGTTSIALGLKGPMLTVNQPGIAGELALARAVTLLAAERAPVVIACGVDELFPLLYATLVKLHVPSPRDAGPEACRPFDQRHNGPILGEGATAVVLETAASAQARGAPILAEVTSAVWGGTPTRAYRYPQPRQMRSSDVLRRALTAAALQPAEVSLAYLSGSGDPQHDAAELTALVDTFGAQSPLVTSVTPLLGEYGGLGMFRVAAATVSLQRGTVPLLTSLHTPIRPEVRFAQQPSPAPPQHVLVHGLARGGTQVALILGRPSAAGEPGA